MSTFDININNQPLDTDLEGVHYMAPTQNQTQIQDQTQTQMQSQMQTQVVEQRPDTTARTSDNRERLVEMSTMEPRRYREETTPSIIMRTPEERTTDLRELLRDFSKEQSKTLMENLYDMLKPNKTPMQPVVVVDNIDTAARQNTSTIVVNDANRIEKTNPNTVVTNQKLNRRVHKLNIPIFKQESDIDIEEWILDFELEHESAGTKDQKNY